ncbi:hypothetical protein ACJX0J_029544, partial [Zea mays]
MTKKSDLFLRKKYVTKFYRAKEGRKDTMPIGEVLIEHPTNYWSQHEHKGAFPLTKETIESSLMIGRLEEHTKEKEKDGRNWDTFMHWNRNVAFINRELDLPSTAGGICCPVASVEEADEPHHELSEL